MRPAESFYQTAGTFIVSGAVCAFLFGWYNILTAIALIYFLLVITNGFERGYKIKNRQLKK